MNTINTEINRPDPSTVTAFSEFSSPLVSDVMDENRGAMDSGIKPAFHQAFVVGPAVTVDAQPGDNLILHKAMTVAEEGDVLVVDASEHSEAGIWGELMSLSARARGIAGAVIDGGIRDIIALAELDYPVFSRHVSPKGSTKRLPGSINVPISCGGVVVNPGDIVVGDADGVAVVPYNEATQTRELCQEKLKQEQKLREGADTPALFEDEFEEILAPLEEP